MGDGNSLAEFSLEENETVEKHRNKLVKYLKELDAAIEEHGSINLQTWGCGLKA